MHDSDCVDDNRVGLHANPNVLDDPFSTTEMSTTIQPQLHDDFKNANTQDVFAEHKLSLSADDEEAVRLESYMKKRGRRRPSQDFLDSRHLLPWQRYKESRKYASVKYIIPQKENGEKNNNETVPYPFEFTPSTKSSVSSSISESSIPSTLSSIQLNLSKSPSPVLPSASESEGSEKNSRKETDEVDDHGRRNKHDQTTTSIAHHIPTSSSQEPSDIRQSLSDRYYQRRRSHQTPSTYERTARRDLPLGYSKPKGFQALKGIFESESGEGIKIELCFVLIIQ